MTQKILYLIPRFTTGGAERLVLEYVRRLQADGIPVAVASIVGGGEMKRQFDELGIPVIVGEKSLVGMVRTWRSIDRFVDDFQPTVIHSHIFSADVCAWFLKTRRSPAARWVSTQHNVREASTRFRQVILRFLLKKVDVVVAVSESVAAFCRTLDVKGDVLCIVNNSIPIEPWLLVPTEGLLKNEKLHLATIGRLEYQKGHDILLQALRALPPDTWQLEVFGSGCERRALTALARELGIANHIVWYGVVHNFISQLGSVDVVVQPSRYEGMSLAIMESMAAARVIVVSTAAGEGIVENTVTGYVVPTGDVAGLTAAIRHVHEHREESRTMALRARIAAQAKFSFSNHWAHMVQLYDRR